MKIIIVLFVLVALVAALYPVGYEVEAIVITVVSSGLLSVLAGIKLVKIWNGYDTHR